MSHLSSNQPDATGFSWNVYFATSNCDPTAKRIGDLSARSSACGRGVLT